MGRIFLSHSSVDKDFVEPVFDFFGADRCIYDKATFEVGMPTLDEIFRGLNRTGIFVFFISNTSLDSEWVQVELMHAEEKLNDRSLAQFFPIIIDDTVKYNDPRIPKFLNKGFGQYNLRHIKTPAMARQKIDAQLLKLQMAKDPNYLQRIDYFYGRDSEILRFKEKHDKRDSNGRLSHLKCMIVSGIDDIGRSAYARHALIAAEIIESYYYPITISLDRTDTIETLIIKLCEVGLGEFTVNDINNLGQMDDKIKILSNLLRTAQEYREIILIEDYRCLVNHNGLVNWLKNSLESIGNQITIIITTNIVIDSILNSNVIFNIKIEEMSKTDTVGVLRGYSKVLGIPFTDNDIDYFYGMMTGYPPQIKFCVEYAKEYGIGYARKKNEKIIEFPHTASIKMINLVLEKEKETYYRDLLDVLARMDITPVRFLEEIQELDNNYVEALDRLIEYSICTYIGASGEFIKINSSIGDYIQRNHFEVSDQVTEILKNKTERFTEKISDNTFAESLPFSEFNFLLKEELKKAKIIPDTYLYPSVFMKSIMELYNGQLYATVVEVVRQMKERGVFGRSEDNVKSFIQYYYCMALTRTHSDDFEEELQFFVDKVADKVNYYFLKGFNFRLNGKYAQAETSYKKVLEKLPAHIKTRRELVIIYVNMQDYDTAFELAKQNYHDFPDNIYHIHAYFSCLIHRIQNSQLNFEEERDRDDIIKAVKDMHLADESDFYYQIIALDEAYFNNNIDNAINILNDGLDKYKKSFYLLKAMFDVYRWNNDAEGMRKVLRIMEQHNGVSSEFTVSCCRAYVEAYEGKSPDMIILKLRNKSGFTEEALQAIKKTVEQIWLKSL